MIDCDPQADSKLRHRRQKVTALGAAVTYLAYRRWPKKPKDIRTEWRWRAMIRQAIHHGFGEHYKDWICER